jgi:hypothetical protein
LKCQVKLYAEYNTNDSFEVNDSCFVFTGWDTCLVKLGVGRPPFSLESFTSDWLGF